jgi:hypothetical protein
MVIQKIALSKKLSHRVWSFRKKTISLQHETIMHNNHHCGRPAPYVNAPHG